MEELIRKKCKEYIDELKTVIQNDAFFEDVFIAGGCIRSLMLGEKVKDVDLFLSTDRSLEYLKGLNIGFLSQNALTLHHNNLEYQIIIHNTNKPIDMVKEFDFKMNMNYYDYYMDYLYISFPDIIKDKRLEINTACRNKLGTLARLFKFLERGYKSPSRNSLLRLGVGLTREEPINNFQQLEERSRLYISEKDYNEIDFVEKPEMYIATNSGQGSFKGSGI